MDNKVLITQMTQLFLIMFTGYMLFKLKYFNVEFNKKLTRIILDVTLPLMILSSVLGQTGKKEYGKIAEVIAVSLAIYIVLPIISIVVIKLLRFKKEQQGLYIFMHTYSNVGFMGFPIINALYGEKALIYAAVLNIMFNLSVYSVGIIIVNYGSGKKESMNLAHLLSPGILGAIASLVIYFIPARFPVAITGAIDSIGHLTSPLAMLLIGSNLANMKLKEVFDDWRVYMFAVVKQFIVPMLCYPILYYTISDEFIRGVIFVLILMPVANTAVLYATRYEVGEKLATKNVFMTTLLSIITIPLAFSIIHILK